MWGRDNSLTSEIDVAWNSHFSVNNLNDLNMNIKSTITALFVYRERRNFGQWTGR